MITLPAEVSQRAVLVIPVGWPRGRGSDGNCLGAATNSVDRLP